ncbi:hypothetical protein JX266_014350 [Neoarthrinium moseri]|nr:hypothetical protein JX266_014350 [Neoarthrinium moseri]
MPSERLIRTRLTILFFSTISLAISILNSANARSAVILRDRARSDYASASHASLAISFESLQKNILLDVLPTAMLSAGFAIYGLVVALHPRFLRDHGSAWKLYAIAKIIISFVMIGAGGYLADHVHDLQSAFAIFNASDKMPYFSLMYYGGIAQAVYGSVLVLFAIIIVIVVIAIDRYQAKDSALNSTAHHAYHL